MGAPACSVVMPLYHGAAEARRAVASALAQTRPDFELLVVDDGAPAQSREAALAFGDRRLRLLVQPHAGAAAARNRGAAEARAPWLAFLDSDDEWKPDFLEKALALAERQRGLAAVFTNILSQRERSPWLRLPFAAPRVLEDYFALALANGGRGMTSSSTLADAGALRRAGGFPDGVARCEDVDTWIRLALAGPVGCVPEVLAVYHDDRRASGRPTPEPSYPQCVRTLRRARAEQRLAPALGRRLERLEALYLLVHVRDLAELGRRRRAREILLRECAWRRCPPWPLAKALLRSLGSSTS